MLRNAVTTVFVSSVFSFQRSVDWLNYIISEIATIQQRRIDATRIDAKVNEIRKTPLLTKEGWQRLPLTGCSRNRNEEERYRERVEG